LIFGGEQLLVVGAQCITWNNNNNKKKKSSWSCSQGVNCDAPVFQSENRPTEQQIGE
jgi:hypothetical protein